jgi:hypothetical protein
MDLFLLPLAAAVLGSVVLLVKSPARLFPIIALAGSGLELLRALAILNLKVPVIGAALLFALAMVVGGAGSWAKGGSKPLVTAATVVVVIGLLQALPLLAR